MRSYDAYLPTYRLPVTDLRDSFNQISRCRCRSGIGRQAGTMALLYFFLFLHAGTGFRCCWVVLVR